ncbi:MAG: hypothetical protein LAO05_08770 [Acidobacteriia bacterium]|nr:hypothetical protein [Terriglobia bacterium]
MPGRVIVCGDLPDRYEAERLLAEHQPGLHLDSVARPWEMVERAMSGSYDVALLLKGPIAAHEARLEGVAGLRRNGFTGKILAGGAFLTEKQDAVRAGADYAFDPDRQALERVVGAALVRPAVAADHPYLRYLVVGEWARSVAYAAELPTPPTDILLAATSCHTGAAFWSTLAAYVRANPSMRCVVVEDDGGVDARTEALATGIQPYVVLEQEGLGKVTELVRRFLRESWLATVTAA